MSNEKGHRCKICGIKTIFFTWSSSRYFNRAFCDNVLGIPEFIYIDINGKDCKVPNSVPVCSKCVKQFELMKQFEQIWKVDK